MYNNSRWYANILLNKYSGQLNKQEAVKICAIAHARIVKRRETSEKFKQLMAFHNELYQQLCLVRKTQYKTLEITIVSACNIAYRLAEESTTLLQDECDLLVEQLLIKKRSRL